MLMGDDNMMKSAHQSPGMSSHFIALMVLAKQRQSGPTQVGFAEYDLESTHPTANGFATIVSKGEY